MNRLLIAALVVSSSTLAWAAPPTGGPGPSTRVLAWTNIIEQAGTVETTPLTHDATLVATYVGGLPETSDSPGQRSPSTVYGATVQISLKQCTSGDDLVSATGQPVCAPCTVQLDSTHRTASLRVDDLIVAAGGFPASSPGAPGPLCGFAVIVVSGDADRVLFDTIGVNSGTTPFPTPLNGPCGGGGHSGHVTLIK